MIWRLGREKFSSTVLFSRLISRFLRWGPDIQGLSEADWDFLNGGRPWKPLGGCRPNSEFRKSLKRWHRGMKVCERVQVTCQGWRILKGMVFGLLRRRPIYTLGNWFLIAYPGPS